MLLKNPIRYSKKKIRETLAKTGWIIKTSSNTMMEARTTVMDQTQCRRETWKDTEERPVKSPESTHVGVERPMGQKEAWTSTRSWRNTLERTKMTWKMSQITWMIWMGITIWLLESQLDRSHRILINRISNLNQGTSISYQISKTNNIDLKSLSYKNNVCMFFLYFKKIWLKIKKI